MDFIEYVKKNFPKIKIKGNIIYTTSDEIIIVQNIK